MTLSIFKNEEELTNKFLKDAYKKMLATIESYIKTQSCGNCKVLLELDEEFRVSYECKYFFHV